MTTLSNIRSLRPTSITVDDDDWGVPESGSFNIIIDGEQVNVETDTHLGVLKRLKTAQNARFEWTLLEHTISKWVDILSTNSSYSSGLEVDSDIALGTHSVSVSAKFSNGATVTFEATVEIEPTINTQPSVKGLSTVPMVWNCIPDISTDDYENLITVTVSATTDTALAIDTNSPANDATGVDIDTDIEWTFNRGIQQSFITSDYFKVINTSDETIVSGSFSYDSDTYKVTFDPTGDNALDSSTDYIAIASSLIRPLTGPKMSADNITTFTTA